MPDSLPFGAMVALQVLLAGLFWVAVLWAIHRLSMVRQLQRRIGELELRVRLLEERGAPFEADRREGTAIGEGQ